MLQREGRCNRGVTDESVDKKLTFLVTVNLKRSSQQKSKTLPQACGQDLHATELPRGARRGELRMLSETPVCFSQPKVSSHFSEKSALSEGSSW